MTRKIAMTTVRTVLNLLSHGLSYKKIRLQTGASNGFINKVATAARPDLQAFLKLSDAEIHERLYPRPQRARVEPDWDGVNALLQQKHMTLQLVYDEYRQANDGQKIYSYSSFCRRYAEQKPNWEPQDLFTNLHYIPGDVMEIDYAGDDLVWVDEYAEVHRDRVFVAALPSSGLIFAQAYESEQQQFWIQGIIEALQYFGGAPKNLVMDNAKALVRHANWTQGDIQPVILDLCEHYGMNAQTCRVHHPRDKNRVEASVNMVECWIIGKLHLQADEHALAKDREHLRKQVLEHLNELNLRQWQGRNASRRVCFEEEERSSLQPLPDRPYDHGEWKVYTVDKGHCIRLSKSSGAHRYSVPARFVGKQMQVKLTEKKVQIYDAESGAFLATHERCYSTVGMKTHLLPEHLTPEEKRTRLSPDQWVNVFSSRIGIDRCIAEKFVAQAFKSDFNGRRLCGVVCSSKRSYPLSVIERAMQAMLDTDIWGIGFFQKQCETIQMNDRSGNLFDNRQPEDADYVTTEHDNIRDDYE